MKVDYVRHCTLHRVIDGDTIEVMVDLGFRRFSRERIRFAGIDSPERNTEAGPAATEFVRQWCEGRELILDSHKKDSFGRWLGTVYRVTGNDHAESLSAALMAAGHAVSYLP